MPHQTRATLGHVVQDVLRHEAQVILTAADRLNTATYERAAEILLAQSGKIIVSGVGKSGHIGRKISATLCSLGSPAVFMHPSEAVHGDLGIYTPGDPSIVISKSGTTSELVQLIPILKEFESPIIAIVGNVDSPLATMADVVLDASVTEEADPNNLAPTSSTTLALAIGDALAVMLMQAKDFKPVDFARYHPGGQLGRNLRLSVADAMHTGDNFAWVTPDAPMKDVIIAMTQYPLGAACVVDEKRRLLGLITDGDLRRALVTHEDIMDVAIDAIMTHQPTTITPECLLKDALELMEKRQSPISVLPVVDDQQCIGLIRLHDIYA
jgi:arabinose-5-phosphate isomerase